MKLDPGDRDAIEEIVEATVKRVFLDLNIDVSTPEKLVAFRETMSDVAEWRRSMKQVKQALTTAAVGTFVAGAIAAIGIGIRQWLAGGGPHG